MRFTTKQIEEKLYADFSRRYKAFGKFVDGESGNWQRCLAAVRDETLLGHIIFCNDVLHIPPTHTFLCARPIEGALSEFEKRAIGAFWGFVFKFVFGYDKQKNVTARVNTVRTASYFSFAVPTEPVEIIRGENKGEEAHVQRSGNHQSTGERKGKTRTFGEYTIAEHGDQSGQDEEGVAT